MITLRNALLGLAVVGGGVVAWKVLTPKDKPKKKALAKKEPEEPKDLKDAYVGSGWVWPRPDRFPSTQAFGEALAELGYGAAVSLEGWEILSTETMNTVMSFQSDYDAVREAILKEGVEIGEYVVIDGLVGEATIRALIFATDWQRNNPDDSWIVLVFDAREKLA